MQHWHWMLVVGVLYFLYFTIARPMISYAMGRIWERWEILLGADKGMDLWIVESGMIHGEANSFWDYTRIYHALRAEHYRNLFRHLRDNLIFDPRKYIN